jgi:predicted transcriptional regulator
LARRKPGRSRLRMYHDVLEIISKDGGRARFTKVLNESGIPYDRFLRYEEELERRGLIAEARDGDARYLEMTREGLRFLEELRRMERFLKDLGLGL